MGRRRVIIALVSLLALLPIALAQSTKISQLPTGAALTGTELIPIVQSATTVTTTPSAIASYIVTTGAFNLTLTGFSGTAPVIACAWVRVGKLVIVTLNTGNGTATYTSNSANFGATGWPSAITPVTYQQNSPVVFMEDNSAPITVGAVSVNTSGTVNFLKNGLPFSNEWTASGLKGFIGSSTVYLMLN
jgi:hypothetical protein